MLKVLKNLKNSLGAVIAIVILLCIQAATDLALPDYTSKIVNEGIQAGGIVSSAPDIISKSDMDTILLFTEQDENHAVERYMNCMFEKIENIDDGVTSADIIAEAAFPSCRDKFDMFIYIMSTRNGYSPQSTALTMERLGNNPARHATGIVLKYRKMKRSK